MAKDKKVTLIEVDVNTSQAKKNVESLTEKIIDQKDEVKANNSAIKDLEKANKDLSNEVKKGTKTQEEANKEIASNEKRIKSLKIANEGVKDSIKSNNQALRDSKKTLETVSNSLGALKKKSSQLTKQLNTQETATEEGVKKFRELQTELKETNEDIRSLDQGAGDFKSTIGNYAGELTGSTKVTELFSEGLGGVVQGFKASTVAALQFIATPVGAVLGALVAVFLLVKNAMNRNEEASNKMKKAFSAFSGIVNFLLKALEPLGEYLIDGIVKGFELASEAADKAIGFITGGLKKLGFDKAANNVEKFTDGMKEAANAAQEIADSQAILQKELRKSEKLQLDFQNQAEKLRQIRDNDSLSIKERIKANKDLGAVLKLQLAEETRIATLRLDTINKQIELEGETSELLDERAEAALKISEIQERITSQESEQLTNRNALLKEAADAEKERQAEIEAIRQEEADAEKERQAEIEAIRQEEADAEKERQAEKLGNQAILNEKLLALEDYRRDQANEKRLAEIEGEQEALDFRHEMAVADFERKLERLQEQEEALAEQKDITEEERAIAQADIDMAKEQALADHQSKLVKIEADGQALRLKNQEKFFKIAGSLISGAQKVATEIFDTANTRIAASYQKRYQNIEDQLKKGDITEEQYAKKKELLDKKKALAEWRIQRRAFLVQKAIDLATVGTAIASSIAKSVNATPLTGGLPFSAINAGIGVIQASAILAKKPPPKPVFAEGGMVVEGKSHAQGGIPIHVGGEYAGEMEGKEGLFVTSREATKSLLNDHQIATGGRSLFGETVRFAENGGRIETGNQGFSAEDLTQAMSNIKLPPIEVSSFMAAYNLDKEARETGNI